MITKGFLQKIGFTEEECKTYWDLNAKVGDIIEPYAKAYMQEEIPMHEALSEIHGMSNLHEYTLDLMFFLACSGYLEEKYRKKGLSEKIFLDTMCDLKYKLDECRTVYGIFGTFVAGWFNLHFTGGLMALGRLQYRTLPYQGEPLNIMGVEIKEGDVTPDCHIPSSGPLTRESCLASYRLAYEAYPHLRKNGILPIACSSWLLYEEFKDVFSVSPNTTAFINDFEIFANTQKDEFSDAWRVFGADADKEPDLLPEKTSLQRAFKSHIKNGRKFGFGRGIILFDGEKVLTAK